MPSPLDSRLSFFNPFENLEHSPRKVGKGARLAKASSGNYRADDSGVRPIPITIAADKQRTLPIIGQGAIALLAEKITDLVIAVSSESEPTSPALYLSVSITACSFAIASPPVVGVGLAWAGRPGDGAQTLSASALKGAELCFIRPRARETYWLSIDKKNCILRYGKSYLNATMTLLEAQLGTKTKGGSATWSKPEYEFISKLNNIQVFTAGPPDGVFSTAIYPYPIVDILPPYVVAQGQLTLDHLARNLVTVPGNLPSECQKLYSNVAGINIRLDDDDFLDFSTAIQHSVSTPGCVGYELCAAKAKNAGSSNLSGTYLRITLGQDLGDSPGVPYVLEIWPAGHHSPIHDHGNSYAVIKVLHGSINVFYYDSLSSDPGPYQLAPPEVLTKDQITWMSKDCYQVHQLFNRSNTVCLTLQCYTYGESDRTHYENFDFLAEVNGRLKKCHVKPGSDMDFLEFKAAIKKEWEAYKASRRCVARLTKLFQWSGRSWPSGSDGYRVMPDN